MLSSNVELALFQINNIEDPSTFVDLVNGYHSHNTIEITYMTSGTLEMEVMFNGKNEKLTLIRKQLCIMMPNIVHTVYVNNPLSSIGVEFASANGDNLVKLIQKSDYIKTNKLLNKFDLTRPYFIINDNGNLPQLLQDLYRYSDRNNLSELDKWKLDLKIKEFFLEVLSCEIANKKIKNSNMILNKSREFIENNYFRDIKAPDVARYINVSYSYLRNLYQNEYGISINKAINKRRIEEAKTLIEKGLPLEKIAKDIGFKNIQYFDSVFKSFEKVSPTKYKNNLESKKDHVFIVNMPDLYSFKK